MTMSGPSRAWYWLGGAMVVLGLGLAALLAATGIFRFFDRIDEFQRVRVGEEGTVVFERAGGYTVYYERRYSSESIGDPDFDVTLTPVEGGEPVRFSEYGSSVTYDVGGRHGRAIYSFRIDEPGRYLLRVDAPSGRDPAPREGVAVGRGLGRGLVARLISAAFIGFWGFAGGAAVIIVTALKRHAARARLREQPGPSPAVG